MLEFDREKFFFFSFRQEYHQFRMILPRWRREVLGYFDILLAAWTSGKKIKVNLLFYWNLRLL